MKKMLAGIFLMVLSVWLLIFSRVDNSDVVGIAAVIFPFIAIAVFLYGYFHKEDKS